MITEDLAPWDTRNPPDHEARPGPGGAPRWPGQESRIWEATSQPRKWCVIMEAAGCRCGEVGSAGASKAPVMADPARWDGVLGIAPTELSRHACRLGTRPRPAQVTSSMTSALSAMRSLVDANAAAAWAPPA